MFHSVFSVISLADLGFFYRGVTLGTRASEAREDCGGLCLRENEFGSRRGTRRHRNNSSHTHNNNMK